MTIYLQQSFFGNQLHIKRAALARAQGVSPNLAFINEFF